MTPQEVLRLSPKSNIGAGKYNSAHSRLDGGFGDVVRYTQAGNVMINSKARVEDPSKS